MRFSDWILDVCSSDLRQANVDHLFPPGDIGHCPLLGITDSKGKTTVARLLARVLQLSDLHMGLACSNGLFFGRRHVQKTDGANWSAARRVLLNRGVQVGVIENGPLTIRSEGLAYDRSPVGIVTNLDPSCAFPDSYIDDA